MNSKVILIVVFFLGIALQAAAQEPQVPIMSFNSRTYEFGDVVEGMKVKHVFKFKNTGSAPLLLNNVLVTCGCTAAKWPQSPVEPGDSGQIEIVFDSKGRLGRQHKVITVLSNAENNPEKLKITLTVVKKEDKK
ncbi:DUF1573 domain-containing protein [Aureibacter tunicatorum]|uniref:DUF1573 domain-containing protein n=1 Tax=Aureibacter tunicatorum TaxID=866807 RepID=A0AAE4BRZ1_9BACT|nr:DUF1573 domain-containing protein [Aureibacter tunicatorum]MDR6238363.1 hypothetical protein [Aureibacter tunicatorum]BDD03395.1 hypothetical protein AUTU_08780 [Aureibacter tunicatorum]